MGWIEKLLISSLFVAVYMLTQAKCGPVNAASVSGDEKNAQFVECSGLLKDLDEMKIKCRGSYKVAKENIDGLKIQLDDLFKQVSNTKSSAKDVLNILQKFIDLQEMDVMKNTERDGAKIKRLEKRQMEAERHLAEMKKDFLGSVAISKHAVSKRSAEPLKSTLTSLNEFKKYLEEKLKQPGEQGSVANQVLQIVLLQIEATELKTRVSGKYKIQVQIDVIKSQLGDKNDLLADLKEVRKDTTESIQKIDANIAATEKEILDLNAELSALKQSLDQLNGQAKEFDGKKTEIMDKIGKLNGKDELISRILILQFEFMEATIIAQGQMKAGEFKIADLQKELVKEQEMAFYLHSDNRDLREELISQEEKCKDLMDMYMKAEAKLETKINEITDLTTKTALQIILLGFEIHRITKQLKTSSNDDLKRKRDEKLKELKTKKEQLQKQGASSEKILKVISQLEDIWTLQNEDPENLKQISNLQKNLLDLIKDIDDKMPSKPMLEILAIQSDVAWIMEMLKMVTAQAQIQKTELQKALDEKQRLLNEKMKELAAATGDHSQLQKDIDALNREVWALKTQIRMTEENAKKKIKDFEEKLKVSSEALAAANKSLKEMNVTLSRQFTKINNLIQEMRDYKEQTQERELQVNTRIADLEKKLKKCEEENAKIRDENQELKKGCVDTAVCPELQKKYLEMQAEYNETISKLNSDILQKAFFIKSLIDEVEYLDKEMALGFPDLRLELEEKTRELEKAKQELKAQGSISAKTLEVLQLLSEIWKLQENPNENSAKIRQLEAKSNGLLTELQNSGEKGLGLSLNMMSIKESISRLQQAQTQMQDKYTREINGLKKQIDDKEKEIWVLNANCGLSAQLKDRIQQLEEEAEQNKQKLKKLQQQSKDDIASLEKQIQTKNKQLANTENELEKTNAENAALIKKLNSLNDDIKKITEDKNYALKKAEEEIAGLNEKVQKQEVALAKQERNLKEKNDYIATLKDHRDNMKDELEKVKEKSRKLETDLKAKDRQLENTEAKMKDIDAENQVLIRKQKKLDDELEKITEEKKVLQNKLEKETSDFKKQLEAQNQELAKKDQKLQEKNKEVSSLQKENDNIKAELKEEKNKFDGMITENEKLKDKIEETKKKLEEFEKKEQLPEIEWPTFNANTAHRRLILSRDEKEARTSLMAQNVLDTPERYDTAIAVLGKYGYDSGKHYWQIGVVGRNCYVVGAARASAQRKGILKYGPSAGYWVILKRRDATLFAIADRPIQLNAPDAPSVIGVQVDFTNNEVTFYDADKKYVIYRFTGHELKEKVYPYIETCSDANINDPPLILSQPQSTDWLKP